MDAVLHFLGVALLLARLPGGALHARARAARDAAHRRLRALYAWATDFTVIHWSTLGWLALLAVVAEGSSSSPAAPVRRARGRRGGSRSARSPARSPAASSARRSSSASARCSARSPAPSPARRWRCAARAARSTIRSRTGLAAMRGRLLGFVVKSAIAVVMVGIVAFAVLVAAARLWPHGDAPASPGGGRRGNACRAAAPPGRAGARPCGHKGRGYTQTWRTAVAAGTRRRGRSSRAASTSTRSGAMARCSGVSTRRPSTISACTSSARW